MKIIELKGILKNKGFSEEEFDTGMNYTKTIGHVTLICYIEPNIDVAFISIYKWNRNDLKGTYNVPLMMLRNIETDIPTFFERTISDIPQYVGEKTDVHAEIRNVIQEIFR